jgi:hypothetical protein
MTTPLDTNLLEELTTSLGGCLATIDLALAVTVDESARHALEAVAMVIATSHEHLCRVDAMVFDKPADEATGPLVMGQPEDPECQHLDLTPVGAGLICKDCAETVEVPGIERHKDEAAEAELERVITEHFPGKPVPGE